MFFIQHCPHFKNDFGVILETTFSHFDSRVSQLVDKLKNAFERTYLPLPLMA